MPFASNICDYKAGQKCFLDNHMSTDSGTYVFHCNNCDFQTNCKNYLATRMLIHTGELPFACDICDYKARWKAQFYNHTLTHSGKNIFVRDLESWGRAISVPPFRRRRLGAADSALDNSAPCRFGAGHFGAVS